MKRDRWPAGKSGGPTTASQVRCCLYYNSFLANRFKENMTKFQCFFIGKNKQARLQLLLLSSSLYAQSCICDIQSLEQIFDEQAQDINI